MPFIRARSTKRPIKGARRTPPRTAASPRPDPTGNPPTENNPSTAGPETRAHAASHEDASLGPPLPGPGTARRRHRRACCPTVPTRSPRAAAEAVRLGHIHKSASPFNQRRARHPLDPRGPRRTNPPQTRLFSKRRRHQGSGARRSGSRSRAAGRSRGPESGGERDRTDDLLLAKQALSQLSYTPVSRNRDPLARWWAREDLNLRPHAYQARALTS